MLSDHRIASSGSTDDNHNNNNNDNNIGDDHDDGGGVNEEVIRDIHALTPTPPSSVRTRTRRESPRESSGGSGYRSPSVSSDVSSEQFSSMSREFNALVLAGATMPGGGGAGEVGGAVNLGRIGEEEMEETNPLAIVPDSHPLESPRRVLTMGPSSSAVAEHSHNAGEGGGGVEEVSLQRVKKEEVESKISAWQTAKIAKINNRFKREDVVINGWEGEQVEKATALLKKVERKLDERRARAVEKMQNDVAKSRRKAEEKRASAEAKRGTKVARVLELANLMRAVGRAPFKRSFF